jgi:hypothetical protein
MFTYSIGDIFRSLEMKYKPQHKDIIILEEKEHKISTGFTPLKRFTAMNLEDNKIQEGIRISLEILSKMNEIYQKNDIIFMVALIPTKESVYSVYLENSIT